MKDEGKIMDEMIGGDGAEKCLEKRVYGKEYCRHCPSGKGDASPGLFDNGFVIGDKRPGDIRSLRPMKTRKEQIEFLADAFERYVFGYICSESPSFFERYKGLRELFHEHHVALLARVKGPLSSAELFSVEMMFFHSLYTFFSLGWHFGFEDGASFIEDDRSAEV